MRRLSLALALLPLFAACSRGNADAPDAGQLIPVRIQLAERRDLLRPYTLTGRLAANEVVEIHAKLTGRIVAFHRDEGDRVRAGDRLVELDKTELALRLARGQAAVAQARARLQEAERRLARSSELFERDITSRAALDGADAEARVARADLRHASADRDLAAQQLADADIVAPIDGVLQDRAYSVGDLVSASAARGNEAGRRAGGIGDPIFTLIQTDPLRLELHVAEQDVRSVRGPGSRVPIRVDLFPGRVFEGVIDYIAPSLDPVAHTLLVRARVDNSEGVLRPGMFARFEGATELARQSIVIPTDALVNRGGTSGVYVLDGDGIARLRPVETVAVSADGAAVASGLAAGDPVVVEGQSKLREGSRTRVVSPHSDS